MGVAFSGHLNDLLLSYSNKLPLEIWPFHHHRATGVCGRPKIPGFRAVCSGGGNARYFRPVQGFIFAEAIIVRQCASVARLFWV